MSRIGNRLICLPEGVTVSFENRSITVTGKHGVLTRKIFTDLQIEQSENLLKISRQSDDRKLRGLHGLMRALVQNMVIGVDQKFSKTLLAEGVGYKFLWNKGLLTLNMGFTNPVLFEVPSYLTVTLESPIRVLISGIDKEAVGLFAAQLRSVRPPEPYKGKGIRYSTEAIRRKVGKARK